MDCTNDIKVTFLENIKYSVTEKIRIFFKDIFNNDIQIDLRPGEFVYSQTNYLSKALVVYSRKGMVSVEAERKPDSLEYYVGYKNEYVDWFNSRLEEVAKIPISVNTSEDAPKLDAVVDIVTSVSKAIKEVKEYSDKKSPKSKSKKGPGRPKKRGPKKGSKHKKTENK